MKFRVPLFLIVLGLLAVAGTGYPQPGPHATPIPVVPAQSALPDLTAPPPATPRPVPEPTLEQMLAGLEALRAQKAEIERREKEQVEAIRKKLDKLRVQMQKLGVEPQAELLPPATK